MRHLRCSLAWPHGKRTVCALKEGDFDRSTRAPAPRRCRCSTAVFIAPRTTRRHHRCLSAQTPRQTEEPIWRMKRDKPKKYKRSKFGVSRLVGEKTCHRWARLQSTFSTDTCPAGQCSLRCESILEQLSFQWGSTRRNKTGSLNPRGANPNCPEWRKCR